MKLLLMQKDLINLRLSPDEALKILEFEVSENKIDRDLYIIFKENLHAIVPGYSK